MESSRTESVIHLFEKIMNRYIASGKKPHDYGTGCILYRSEVHTIDAIGKHSGTNITLLSNYLGVTKSATSQMIDKLVKKELVTKDVLSKSDTEVSINLTSKGKKVYQAHIAYHLDFFKYMDELLSTVSEKDMKIFFDIMNHFDSFLENNN